MKTLTRPAVFFAADQAEGAAFVSHLAFLGIGATLDDARSPRVTVAGLSQAALNELVDAWKRRRAGCD